MLNIKWGGRFESEDELTHGSVLPDGAVMFREGDTMQNAFGKGFLLMLPIMVVVIGLSLFRIGQFATTYEAGAEAVVAFILALVALQCLTYLHELIHALLYPRQAEKTIWSYKRQGAYFVYCNAVVSKRRFIVLSIAPMVVLGVVPFAAWLCFAEHIDMPYSLAVLFVSWLMIFGSLGDLANVYHAATQVPKGGRILNFGLHSYWLK